MRPLARWRTTTPRSFKAVDPPHILARLPVTPLVPPRFKAIAPLATHHHSLNFPSQFSTASTMPASSSNDVTAEHPSPLPRVEETATSPSTPPPSNMQVTNDEDGVSTLDFTFKEEPLGLTEEQTYGFPQLEFGQRIGPTPSESSNTEGRYKIVRKLGFGRNSSVWLAFDERFARRSKVILTCLQNI